MLVPLHSDPRLRHVNTEVFELRYYAACMDCGFCKDACCLHGADVNVLERDRILANAARLTSHVSTPPEGWFTTDESVDPEYPGGRYVRTQIADGACVFLNRTGRGCLLHAWALQEKRDYHDVKPMVCWMFPLIYDQGVLRASLDVRDGLVCVGEGLSLYRSVRKELLHFFGPALVEELDRVEGRL